MSAADLEGRVALVSGGGRGIGLAIVRALAARGASVVIADNGTGIDGNGADPSVARAAAEALGARARPFTDSIASPGAAASAVALAARAFGGLDIVVNNAAILRDAFVFKSDPADWEAVIRTNLSAPYYLLAAATPLMREQAKEGRGGGSYAWGRIVNITSSAGFYGNLGQAAYASAKAGLFGLTRVTAMEMARSRVTSNALIPFAATRVTESIKPANQGQAIYKERAMKAATGHVAAAVAWLCSDAAAAVTGQLIAVRGRELFLFGQPRPVARLVREGGEDDTAALAAQAARDFAPHYTDLKTDLEHFNSEPVV
jgi:NAD(P)-dependent dehydrogenase (short-subunit alcohol dehydrogenase family)